MRSEPSIRANQARVTGGRFASSVLDGNNGAFLFARRGAELMVIASDGLGWEHVSVSTPTRCPTHEEMEFVREQFWRDDECVMLLSVPRSEHINQHAYCLHMWRPIGIDIPRPPALMVGLAPSTDGGGAR